MKERNAIVEIIRLFTIAENEWDSWEREKLMAKATPPKRGGKAKTDNRR